MQQQKCILKGEIIILTQKQYNKHDEHKEIFTKNLNEDCYIIRKK